ncbi:MAG: 2-hydroxyacid dehydrogenase [Amphritea sp.]
MKAVFLDLESLDFGDLNLAGLQAEFSDFTGYAETNPDEVAERIADADVVIVNKVPLSASVLAQASALKLVCIAATGTNIVDLQAAEQLGIRVVNCQAYGTASVVQHVMMLILALHTNLIAYHSAVQAGDWGRSRQFCLLNHPIEELEGKTLGIIGYGNLGAGVAKIAEAFGMKVLIAQRGVNPKEGRIPLDELLPQVDVVTLHCPLTDETRDLIDSKALAMMKPGAFLVNAARGGIVNETALAAALKSAHLGGAATDVLSVEPPVDGNPLLDTEIPNLIVTPHSAWGSLQARQRIVDQMTQSIAGFKDGQLIRKVV